MFDNKSVNIQQPQRIIHEEKRAPTDESIRLAIELEEKILKKIIDKLHCNDNVVKISFFSLSDPIHARFICKLSINGNEYSNEFSPIDSEKMIDELIKWIAYQIVKPVIDEVYFNLNKIYV